MSQSTAAPRGSRHVVSGADPKSSTARSERILDGAGEMFASYGCQGAGLRMIADHMDMPHPGMLHHFSTKEALLDSVIGRLEKQAQSALDAIHDLSRDVESFRRELVNTWHPESHSMQLLPALYADTVSEDYPGRARMPRLCLVHEHVLEQCLARFAEQGLIDPAVDTAFARRAMLHQILGSAVRARTVRVLQRSPHDDDPLSDLDRLLR